MSLELIDMLELFNACAEGKGKMVEVSTMAVPCSINGERLFMDISSPSIANMGGKKL